MASDEMRHLASAEDLGDYSTAVGIIRESLPGVHCEAAALSGAELAKEQALEVRAAKWADEADLAIAAEQSARDQVVAPLCQADLLLEHTRAAIARERSNPAGVVDLHLLHQYGQDEQYYRDRVSQLAPAYRSLRKHAFTDWRAEGACVAARNAS